MYNDNNGATAIEYGLIASLVSIVILSVMMIFGQGARELVQDFTNLDRAAYIAVCESNLEVVVTSPRKECRERYKRLKK